MKLDTHELIRAAQHLTDYAIGFDAITHTGVLPGTLTPALADAIGEMWAVTQRLQAHLADQATHAAANVMQLLEQVQGVDRNAAQQAVTLCTARLEGTRV